MQTLIGSVPIAARLAAREFRAALLPWGIAAVALACVGHQLTGFVAPPFWFAERRVLLGEQAHGMAYVAGMAVWTARVIRLRLGRRGAWQARLDSNRAVLSGEAAGLFMGMAAVAVGCSLAVQRNASAAALLGVCLPFLGVACLAPGLVRAPVPTTILVLATMTLVPAQLGLLGSAFPLRVDTVLATPTLAPVAAYLLAAAAGLFASLGLSNLARQSSRTCG